MVAESQIGCFAVCGEAGDPRCLGADDCLAVFTYLKYSPLTDVR